MKRVEIISKEPLFKKSFFHIEQATLKHELFDGSMSSAITRVIVDRGDGAAALLHDKHQNAVVLVEQFRYPTYVAGQERNGWTFELPSGILEPGENPEATIQREIKEETGYSVSQLQHINTFYLSPGGSSERIFLYYVNVTDIDRVTMGGGILSENEDLRVEMMPVGKALQKVRDGEIVDAKTIVALQWLQIQQNSVG